MNATNPADFLRLMLHTQLTAGMITPAFAEQALMAVNELAQAATIGQQVVALGTAAASPAPVVAPTLKVRPLGKSRWARHQHYLTEGRSLPRESAADRNARQQAESIGYVR